MKASLIWSAPKPEMTIAVAMRRCYSTKTIEEIEAELEQKGPEYWKYLLTRALQDKSLDVIEHFTMTLLLKDMREDEARWLTGAFSFVRLTRLGEESWLLSMNARTLIEMWRDGEARSFASVVVGELDSKGICPILSQLAFGGGAPAR
jgi:hypothetical protein